MKRVAQPNVLFVNIGWAEEYDGRHLIHGNHEDILKQRGDPLKLGEGRAFLPDCSSFVQCGAGTGQVRLDSYIDIVFVARNPSKHRYEIVGIYFEPNLSYHTWINHKGNPETCAEASTKDFKELLPTQRPSIVWGRGRSMRRWVSRKGKIRYPALFAQYVASI
jgi:hypothetical protein